MPRESFNLTVNYDLPFGKLIKTGNYLFASTKAVPKNFASKGTGVVKMEGILINFARRRGITSAEVLRYFRNHRFRPAGLSELVAFGATYLDNRDKPSIVALGSIWKSRRDGEDYVTAIESTHRDARPALMIRPLRSWWSGLDWFLFVREEA